MLERLNERLPKGRSKFSRSNTRLTFALEYLGGKLNWKNILINQHLLKYFGKSWAGNDFVAELKFRQNLLDPAWHNNITKQMKDQKRNIKKRIEKLKKVINHHRYLYHVLDRQEISESALDSLKKELFDLEQKYPEFITPDSPTQRVGGKPLDKFEKVRHLRPMLSFNDAFSVQDIKDWLERNLKLLGKEEIKKIDFYCEPKLDGLAIELTYRTPAKGNYPIFKTGSTRGDGIVGEDVTQNLRTIEAIPLGLRDIGEVVGDLEKMGLKETARIIREKGLGKIIVRGEAIITKKNFEKVNKEQEKLGLPAYANPRNLAAGSIRQLDPKVTAKRHLDSIIYDLVSDFGQKTHEEEHKILHILGFKTNNKCNKYCKDLERVFEYHKHWQKNREELPYEIDGVVVQINKNKIFEKLGVAGKAPRAAIAYKFPLKQATTKVKDIQIHVGRTGALTPVAILEPVKVGGVTISRATLHNEDEIKKLGVRIGDTVIVGRAGDVIPDIIKVLPELRTGKERKFKFPKYCPVCKTKLVKPEGEVIWRCPNRNCFAQRRRRFYHFVSKGAFDVVGLGPKVVDQLLEQKLVLDPADIFRLEEGDLIPLERFADKSAKNLVKAIQKSRKISLERFIYAIGIHYVGEQTAIDLAEYFGTLEKLKSASIEELQGISDIGPVVARSVYKWFRNEENVGFLRKLVKIVRIERSSWKETSQKLKGKTFLFTGTLSSLTRDEAKEKVRELGGRVVSVVSSQLDFLVRGEAPGSKLKKAQEIQKEQKTGLKIIHEPQFLKILKDAKPGLT